MVEIDRPVIELPQCDGGRATSPAAIGRNVADLIENGSTLQMGIGEIPDAVLLFLKEKRDLGIHTEMFSDGVVELFEARGRSPARRRPCTRARSSASFVLGSKRTFDFLDNNPFVEFHPSDYVNDPFVIAQNDKMVAINSAIAVDLTGQVCADSMGRAIYSGFGGQVDFIRGAARSRGGKPVIALPVDGEGRHDLAHRATCSAEGSGVVTSRADVHYVVTEYGVANLLRQVAARARAGAHRVRAPGVPRGAALRGAEARSCSSRPLAGRGTVGAAGEAPRTGGRPTSRRSSGTRGSSGRPCGRRPWPG